MWKRFRAGLCLAATIALAVTTPGRAQDADTVSMHHDPLKYRIIISATRTAKPTERVPNAATVVSGEELRRRGTRTLAEALQDIVGLDTGEGSDNGMLLPNIGLWGLKEFDALLITVDGVPVGGPFNPSLSQISVEDIDRVEVVKGPQGTLYGVSAFAGMIQIYTRHEDEGRGHITVGGGSFDSKYAFGALQHTLPGGTALRLSGGIRRSDGWQDRTGADLDQGALSLRHSLGAGTMSLSLVNFRDTQRWGTAMPFDAGAPVAGFETDRNYAVKGARLDHRVFGATSTLSYPLATRFRFENTLGLTHDRQISVRSFPAPDAIVGTTLPSEGVAIRPRETTAFEDARLVSHFDMAGAHELVTGAALTWGRTVAAGEGFDFDQELGDAASIPDLGDIPAGDLRSFEDRRTFFGVYAHDEWSASPWLVLSGGGRYDDTNEKLHAQAQEQAPGSPLEVADDARTNAAWSGDIAALIPLVQHETSGLSAANLYASWKSSFKPAAPNLTEAEGAEILDPERTHSLEVGLKTRALDHQLSFDASWFDMKFENMVVSTLGPDTLPELINAGKERFKGFEVDLGFAPNALPGTSVSVGYAHHDPRFVAFTFVTPDGQLRNVSGKLLELAPREMVNAKLDLRLPAGLGAFAAVRYQGRRALTRRNTFFHEPYTEWDAGGSFARGPVRVSVTGRNLGDDRRVTGESDIGDSQFYLAPPRRVTAEVSYGF
jgi:iron complex outermembrane recepter protein